MISIVNNSRLFIEKRWQEAIFNDNRKTLQQRNKLRTYRTFKFEIFTEDYVNSHMKRCFRRAYCLFRFVCAPITIETGRYKNTPLDQRICPLCDSNLIEDEFHCFMVCTFYDALRSDLFIKINTIDPLFSNFPEIQKFIYMFSNGDLCNYVAKFAYRILLKRKEFLFNDRLL